MSLVETIFFTCYATEKNKPMQIKELNEFIADLLHKEIEI